MSLYKVSLTATANSCAVRVTEDAMANPRILRFDTTPLERYVTVTTSQVKMIYQFSGTGTSTDILRVKVEALVACLRVLESGPLYASVTRELSSQLQKGGAVHA